MAELVFVKLGGSLITEKDTEGTARHDVIHRLAEEVRQALDSRPSLSLLLGHGSGSFGHMVAKRYHVERGCTDWKGYALTSAAAARLNRLVTDALLSAGVPAVALQPSASAKCRGGELLAMAVHPIKAALQQGLVPLVYGDVALDESWGTAIASTEAIFSYLASHLHPDRLLLMGEVEGVYREDPRSTADAQLIPLLRAGLLDDAAPFLGGSHAVDVTGGMRSKVLLMADLVRRFPSLRVNLLSGLKPGLLRESLCDPLLRAGTTIVA